MSTHDVYMRRCLELAMNGAGRVSPNPMVGCVIVHSGKIIAEGWHEKFGESHAEVNAIVSVQTASLLKDATLYVSLEPCSHQGKTPPCVDLILEKGIRKVVVGMKDPNPLVAGSGIRRLKEAGVEVNEGVLEKACAALNHRFIHFHEHKRPFIILKWAQSKDGFLAPHKASMSSEVYAEKRHLTGIIVNKLVHRWRAEEDAILVGTNTVLADDPALTVRNWFGRNPLRVTMDRNLVIPENARILNAEAHSLVFTEKEKKSSTGVEFIKLNFNENLVYQIVEELYKRGVQSLIVEGGLFTLQKFMAAGYWDEARVFHTSLSLGSGVSSPGISGQEISREMIDGSELIIYRP